MSIAARTSTCFTCTCRSGGAPSTMSQLARPRALRRLRRPMAISSFAPPPTAHPRLHPEPPRKPMAARARARARPMHAHTLWSGRYRARCGFSRGAFHMQSSAAVVTVAVTVAAGAEAGVAASLGTAGERPPSQRRTLYRRGSQWLSTSVMPRRRRPQRRPHCHPPRRQRGRPHDRRLSARRSAPRAQGPR